MSLQRYGHKKITQLRALTGLDLNMVWNEAGAGEWRQARDRGDIHYRIHLTTGEYEVIDVPHFSSCPGHQHYDPEQW